VGTKQNVETRNLYKKVFSPWELTFMTIDKHGGHHILKTIKPYKEWCRTKMKYEIWIHPQELTTKVNLKCMEFFVTNLLIS
jgi:hypothetical protein